MGLGRRALSSHRMCFNSDCKSWRHRLIEGCFRCSGLENEGFCICPIGVIFCTPHLKNSTWFVTFIVLVSVLPSLFFTFPSLPVFTSPSFPPFPFYEVSLMFDFFKWLINPSTLILALLKFVSPLLLCVYFAQFLFLIFFGGYTF